MKTSSFAAAFTAAILLGGAIGFLLRPGGTADRRPVAKGILSSVEWTLPGGGTGGLTRRNHSSAVPGGNGSWNVDAEGTLFPEFLLITYRERPELGPRIIPARRLVAVQFGDGGIRKTAPRREP